MLLFVGGGFRFSGTVALRKGAENFAVVVSGSDAVALERPFRGTIVAPRSAVRLAPVGTPGYEGSFFGERIDVEARTAVRGRTFQGWAGFLCEKAEGPSLAAAMALPATCTAYSGCCGGSMREVTLTSGPDRYDVGEHGACVVASDGADTITGCKMAGSVVLGGAGNDNLQLGQGRSFTRTSPIARWIHRLSRSSKKDDSALDAEIQRSGPCSF